ncbi:MAG TPA: hypothetical protein VD694_00095, partial [Nitrososphaeraceae archaeon]|nr:hypothetical protein [Nitrososphaeraceae archaeon]
MKTLKNNNRKISVSSNTFLATVTTAGIISTLTIIFGLTTALASATTPGNNTTAITSSVEGEQEDVSSTTTTTNNASNALLGRLLSYNEGEDVESNVNPVNGTYIVISYSGNRIILPLNATGVINATETGNVT